MGDRAQVRIDSGFDEESVYLYTHWTGTELLDDVKTALRHRQRWTDAEYLARIIFCQMLERSGDKFTGFGISTAQHGDLNHPLIIVDVKTQAIIVGEKITPFEKTDV